MGNDSWDLISIKLYKIGGLGNRALRYEEGEPGSLTKAFQLLLILLPTASVIYPYHIHLVCISNLLSPPESNYKGIVMGTIDF